MMRSLNLIFREMKILTCNFLSHVHPTLIVMYAHASVTNMDGTLQIEKTDTTVKEKNENKMMAMYILSFLGNSFGDYSNQELYFHPFSVLF